jgi:hypothetical protein
MPPTSYVTTGFRIVQKQVSRKRQRRNKETQEEPEGQVVTELYKKAAFSISSKDEFGKYCPKLLIHFQEQVRA